MSEEKAAKVKKPKPEPGVGTIFGPTLKQFEHVVIPTDYINKMLAGAGNVIRPSLAFDLITNTIKVYLDLGIPEFVNHRKAWEEALNILEKLRDDVAGSKIDSAAAMVLEPFEWKVADIFFWYGRMATTFRGNYLSYIGNRSSNSFGELTPAECLKLIYFVLYPCAPTSSWSYGPWKDPSQTARGMWDTWPWAEYTLGTIRKTYIDLEEVFNFTDPGSSFPWSRG